MKRFLKISMLFFAMAWIALAGTLNAQQTITVCDGTSYVGTAPVYGGFADMVGSRSQSLYPAEKLADMPANSLIYSLVFYREQGGYDDWGNGTFRITLAETANTNLANDFADITAGTEVYIGYLGIVNDMLTIEFDEPYLYQGGNLVINVEVAEPGEWLRVIYFTGEDENEDCVRFQAYSPATSSVLPKVTISYEQGGVISCPRPNGLAISNLTHDSATLSWNAGGSESTWEVLLNGVPEIVASNTHSLSLNQGEIHTVRVRAICGEGDSSAWSAPLTFTAPRMPANLPFTCDFEDATINGFWGFSDADQVNAWHIGSTVSNGTGNGLYVSDDGGVSYAYNTYLPSYSFAYCTFNLEASNTYSLNYDWKCMGEMEEYIPGEVGIYDYMRVFVVPASTLLQCNYSNGIYDESEPEGWIAVDGGRGLAGQNDWQMMSTEFMVPADGAYNLVFYWYNDGSDGTEIPAAVDNITLDLATCFTPVNLTVSAIMETSAVIAWTDNNPEASTWELEVNGVAQTVTQTPYTLTGLSAATTYTVRVRTLCSEDDASNWTAAQRFTSACGAIVVTDEDPYRDGFEDEDFLCWMVDVASGDPVWRVGTDMYYEVEGDPNRLCEGNQYAYLTSTLHQGDAAYLISPILDLTAVSDPVLYFAHAQADWAGDQNTLTIFYRTVATEAWQVLVPEDDSDIQDWRYDMIDLPNASASYQIAFYGVDLYGHAIVIDDVYIGNRFEIVVPCETPANITVTPDATTAVVAWESEAESWNIRVNGGEPTLITSNPYTLTGLEPSTTYTVEIQAVCSEENTSEWSEGVSFTTTVGIAQYEGIATTVFPNPATAELNVRLSTSISGEIAIYDVFGKMLKSANIAGQTATINVADLANGVYILRISDGQAVVANTRFVKK